MSTDSIETTVEPYDGEINYSLYESPEDEDVDIWEDAEDDWQWCGGDESSLVTSWNYFNDYKKKRSETISIYPSQFTQFAFRMPVVNPSPDKPMYENFSFEGRPYLKRPYDTKAERVLLICGRQTEKTTMLGNKMISYSCLIPSHKSLYVSPSATQTKKFSNDRIKEPLETSDVLRVYASDMVAQNVFEKTFKNRSNITLRYAFLNADRTRGIMANKLFIDEFQDILMSNVDVIARCTDHSDPSLKGFIYSGTPKTWENAIEIYRSEKSTCGEWVVPCTRHSVSTPNGPIAKAHWNILGEKNIEKHGLSCEKCHKPIDAQDPAARWAFQAAFHETKRPWESYRVPQLIVPWKPWKEILLDYEQMDRARFNNEVLGLSFDSGMRPLTKAQLQVCCNGGPMTRESLEKYRKFSYTNPIYAGIDWGFGEAGYTILTLATYVDNKFTVFYIHRFVGADLESEIQMNKIIQILNYFNVRLIGMDYGAGHTQFDTLVRKYGKHKVHRFSYHARLNKKMVWDKKRVLWKLHRTDVMSDLFNTIKRATQITFPRWEDFGDPYGQDILNIFSFYNESIHCIQYDHSPMRPDDSFHSILYTLVVSSLIQPRPDIFNPNREDPRQGPTPHTPGWGQVDQDFG